MDPMPLPAPYVLFKILLLVTFLLHLLAMNGMFGGGFLAAVARWRGRKDPLYLRMAGDIGKKIPSFMAATITLGIAPLLFTQVLFGQYLYTSSVLMAWPWLSVVLLVLLAYYGFYVVAFKKTQETSAARWFGGVSLALVFIIAFIYCNNFSLMLMPGKWFALYRQGAAGWHFPAGDASLIPRYLHFVAAALAVGGLFVAAIGWFGWKKDEAYGRSLIRFGGSWFSYTTMAQVIVGLWFLLSLPKKVMMQFMGENLLATVLFAVGFLLALALIPMMSAGVKKHDPRPALLRTIGATVLLLVVMVVQRDILRHAYLRPYFNSAAFSTQTQWDVLGLFLILFLGGVYLWILMMRRYFTS